MYLFCRTIGLSDYQTVGLLDRRTIGLSDYQTVGLLDRWTIGVSDYNWFLKRRLKCDKELHTVNHDTTVA
jgi:hypothetical protein